MLTPRRLRGHQWPNPHKGSAVLGLVQDRPALRAGAASGIRDKTCARRFARRQVGAEEWSSLSHRGMGRATGPTTARCSVTSRREAIRRTSFTRRLIPPFVPLSPPRSAIRFVPRNAGSQPLAGAEVKPRWALRRLGRWVREQFARRCCRETIRRAPARARAVLEESPQAARPRQARATAGFCCADRRIAGRRARRAPSPGLSR